MIWQPKLWNKKKGQSLKVTTSSLVAPQTWVAVNDPCVTSDGQKKQATIIKICVPFLIFLDLQKKRKNRSNNFFLQVWKNMDCHVATNAVLLTSPFAKITAQIIAFQPPHLQPKCFAEAPNCLPSCMSFNLGTKNISPKKQPEKCNN